MQQEKHASFTGSEASISKEVNGTFEVYNGYCHGTNIELVPNQKLSKTGILLKKDGQMIISQNAHSY